MSNFLKELSREIQHESAREYLRHLAGSNSINLKVWHA